MIESTTEISSLEGTSPRETASTSAHRVPNNLTADYGRQKKHLLCHTHAMLWPCHSTQGHGPARPSRDGLLATCPLSDSSDYHAEFHEDCYQKYTNLKCRWPVWNQKRLSWTSKRVVVAHYKKDDLLNCWISSLDISGWDAYFHYGHGTVGAWQGRGMACVN